MLEPKSRTLHFSLQRPNNFPAPFAAEYQWIGLQAALRRALIEVPLPQEP
jgi:hypothetical protein